MSERTKPQDDSAYLGMVVDVTIESRSYRELFQVAFDLSGKRQNTREGAS